MALESKNGICWQSQPGLDLLRADRRAPAAAEGSTRVPRDPPRVTRPQCSFLPQ